MQIHYVANDGVSFSTETECLNYERALLISTIKAKPLSEIDFNELYDSLVSTFNLGIERDYIGNIEEHFGWKLINLVFGDDWEELFSKVDEED